MVPAAGTELIKNGGFEGDLTDWYPINPEVTVVADAKSGSKAVSTTGAFSVGAPVAPVTCGKTYTLTFQAKFVGGGGYATCNVEFWNASNQKISPDTSHLSVPISSVEANSEFFFHTGSKVAPVGATSGNVYCWRNSGTLVIDDISLKSN